MFGVLPVYKPAGFTSRDVVNCVYGAVKPSRAGHTGTLDPMATGVLLVAVGAATRLVEFSHYESKSYIAEFQLGVRSDTLDCESDVHPLADPPPIDPLMWEMECQNWLGPIQQVPPKYSAISIQGHRAYDLARRGKDFEIPSRTVQVHSIVTHHFEYPMVRMEIDCGTGTYIRSLGSDIARRLGSDAVMTSLIRTRVGQISLDQCVSITKIKDRQITAADLLPPTSLLSALPHLEITDAEAVQLRNGVPIACMKSSDECPTDQAIAAIDREQQLVAILTRENDIYRSLRVFHKQEATETESIPKRIQSPES